MKVLFTSSPNQQYFLQNPYYFLNICPNNTQSSYILVAFKK